MMKRIYLQTLQRNGRRFESYIAHQKMKAQHKVLGFFCGIERSLLQ